LKRSVRISAGSARRAVLVAALAAVALHAVAPPARAQAPAQAAARAELARAIRVDDAHALRTALLRGADANARDEFGEPVLVAAAKAQAWNSVRALAELRGTDLDATNREGATALMYAALHGEQPVVEFLVSREAQVNKTGWTPLHFAAANGHVGTIRFLLERHAYIDAESPNGTTPLMMAARQAHPTAVRLLVEEGADPTPRNQAGLDAAAYARAAGDPELSKWLSAQSEAFRRKYAPAPAGR
jgi:ankyrin repeat protein